MTLRGLLITFLLWLLLAALVAAGSAQTAPPPQIAAVHSANGASELSFDKRTHERKLREAKAELETVRQARTKVGAYRKWVFSLGISLILLGLIAGCAQLAADPWNKRITTVAAAMVVAVTAAKTSYYPMERTAIDGLVVPADDAITDQERFLGHYSEELRNDSPDQQTIKGILTGWPAIEPRFSKCIKPFARPGCLLGSPRPWSRRRSNRK